MKFQHGNALEPPFADGAFDVVWTQNSGMNIEDKSRLYREFRRVLRPGGSLAIQEPVVGPVQPPHFPLMWAADASGSFLLTADGLRRLILGTGFTERAFVETTTPPPQAAAQPGGTSIQRLVMGDRLPADPRCQRAELAGEAAGERTGSVHPRLIPARGRCNAPLVEGRAAEAVIHLEQALGTLGRLSQTRETTEVNIDLRLDLRNAVFTRDLYASVGEHLHEAEKLARRLGDQPRLGRTLNFMVLDRLNSGDLDESIRLGQEAFTIARTLGDRSIEVATRFYLGVAHAARGEHREAATFFEGNAALEGDLRYERFGTSVVQSAESGALLASMLSHLGRFDEAIQRAEVAVRIAEAAEHPFTLHLVLFDLGHTHLRRGDLPPATLAFERCLDLCRTWQFAETKGAVALGAAYALAGRTDEGLRLVAGAVEELRRLRLPRGAGAISCGPERPTSRPGASTKPRATPERRWRSPVSGGGGASRPTPSASPVTSGQPAGPRTRKAITGRRWRSPASSGCARSSPTATSGWERSPAARTSVGRRRSTSPARRRCTARWTCASGCRRQRWRWPSWHEA